MFWKKNQKNHFKKWRENLKKIKPHLNVLRRIFYLANKPNQSRLQQTVMQQLQNSFLLTKCYRAVSILHWPVTRQNTFKIQRCWATAVVRLQPWSKDRELEHLCSCLWVNKLLWSSYKVGTFLPDSWLGENADMDLGGSGIKWGALLRRMAL